MFPLKLTVTINTPAELGTFLKAAGLSAGTTPTTDTKEVAAAPVEKPRTSAATTESAAPGPRTAAAAAETAAPAKTVAASSPTAASAAAEPQASTAARDVAYADLQKVILKLHAKDPTATQAIAKSMGLENFKPLKEDGQGERRAEALKLIEAKLAELEG